MGSGKVWLVRAGEGAAHVGEFVTGKHVAIGWREVGPVTPVTSDEELEAAFAKAYPDEKPGTRRTWMGTVRRFVRDVAKGDGVMTYDPEQRIYYLGEIESDLEARDHGLSRARRVRWTHQIARDSLGQATRNSLGSNSTDPPGCRSTSKSTTASRRGTQCSYLLILAVKKIPARIPGVG